MSDPLLKRNLFIALGSGCLGLVLGAFIVYRFYVGFVDHMLNLRYSVELGQDVATYRLMQTTDYDKASLMLRARMVGNAIALKAQCDRLSPEQEKKADELFQAMKAMGVDATSIPGTAALNVSLDSCSKAS